MFFHLLLATRILLLALQLHGCADRLPMIGARQQSELDY